MSSRLLQRLDAAIAASPPSGRLGTLTVQRALLLARHGEMARAGEQLLQAQGLALRYPQPELGAWLHFAAGLFSYYTDFSSAAQPRIARAQVIARQAKLPALDAICSAWLAMLAYLDNDIAVAVGHASHCDRLAAPDDHGARYRLCTTLGLAHHLAGPSSSAQGWYAAARGHALADGDDAALSALMFNMAQLRMVQARHDSLSNRASGSKGLLLGADSIAHYDAAVGGSVMPGLTAILRAQILTVEGDFAAAMTLFENHLPAELVAGLARYGCSLLADLAWCRVNQGQPELALLQALEAEAELDPQGDLDDRAVTFSRLAQIHARLGDKSTAARHQAAADAEWQEVAALQADWAQTLQQAGLKPR